MEWGVLTDTKSLGVGLNRRFLTALAWPFKRDGVLSLRDG